MTLFDNRPICTYGGQGCKKTGLLPETHSVVYSSTSKPLLLPGEPRPGYPAIPVDMTGHEKLLMESRVDYSNLKVRLIPLPPLVSPGRNQIVLISFISTSRYCT